MQIATQTAAARSMARLGLYLRLARLAGLMLLAAAGLTACDNGPSAVSKGAAARPSAPSPGSASAVDAGQGSPAAVADHRNDPVRLVNGRPLWAASRRASADENARRAFERNGAAFGASTQDDYVARAHAFVEHPPKGVQTLSRRNGDTLYYDPKANIFAVASRDGAPRTMFKPDDGAAYWDEQKTREARSRREGSRLAREDP